MSRSCKVWSKFSSKTADGETLKFRIIDMPHDRYKDVADLMQKYFVTEEAFFRASGIPENVSAMIDAEEMLQTLWDRTPHRVTVCCIDDGTENVLEIIGASLMVVATKHDILQKLNPQTKEAKKFLEIISSLFSKFDTLNNYGLDTFYDDKGVVVHPKYRRLGITREFFKIRRRMCKQHGIPLTGAWMTSIGTQKAAEQDGWETTYEVIYNDFGDEYGVTFKDTPPTCKYMIGRPE